MRRRACATACLLRVYLATATSIHLNLFAEEAARRIEALEEEKLDRSFSQCEEFQPRLTKSGAPCSTSEFLDELDRLPSHLRRLAAAVTAHSGDPAGNLDGWPIQKLGCWDK